MKVHSEPTGFTLAEMVVSMMIMGVLAVGIGSSLLVASHALPEVDTTAGGLLASAEAVEQFCSELQYATAVNSRSATAIQFTVADRDQDSLEEVIDYAWSGSAGDPLFRTYNSGQSIPLVEAVQTLDLSYGLQSTSTETPTGNESGESTLLVNTFDVDITNYSIKESEEYAVYFEPSLPGDALSWKVTSVQFMAMAEGDPDGACKIQLQLPTTGNLPSGVILEEKTLLESSLTASYSSVLAPFTTVSGLDPDQGLCLVFAWTADTSACELKGDNDGVGTSNCHLIKSSDKGVSWSAYPDASLSLDVQGTVTTPGTPSVDTVSRLRTVDIVLNTETEDIFALHTAANLLNQPEVTE